jgi:hypothetical protein
MSEPFYEPLLYKERCWRAHPEVPHLFTGCVLKAGHAGTCEHHHKYVPQPTMTCCLPDVHQACPYSMGRYKCWEHCWCATQNHDHGDEDRA